MMGINNFDIYFQIMCGILIRAYHHNRLLILKEFCMEWNRPLKKDKKLTHCPVTYRDVEDKQYRNRLFFTSGVDSSFRGILVTKEMKQLIKTPGECFTVTFFKRVPVKNVTAFHCCSDQVYGYKYWKLFVVFFFGNYK